MRSRPIVAVWCALAMALIVTPAHAAFPGANGKIAFVKDQDVWVMNADGTGQANLTNNPAIDGRPSWSPDGQRIVFDSNRSGIFQLHTMLSDGTGVQELTYPNGAWAGKWSPDGAKLVFITQGSNEEEVWTMNADGTNPQYFWTLGDGVISAVDWSPSGSRLAADAEDPSCGVAEIFTVDSDGADQQNLTDTCLIGDHSPSWSPDASRLAWRGTGGDGPLFPAGIWLMNADGTDKAPVFQSFDAGGPAWSPDGSKIAFTRSSGVWVMDSDGTDLQQITTSGIAYSWQPIPINSYPRPKGATPARFSLTTAYDPCTSPDRTHGPPLAFGSCSDPQKTSAHLTVGTGDSNGLPARSEGYLLLRTQVGAPGGPDDADVAIELFIDDVFTDALADYTGELRARVTLQITDKDNTPHPGGPGAATTTPIPLEVITSCAAVPDPLEGSVCATNTTADALAPGTVKEGRRSVWALGRAEVYDGGPDGDASTLAGDTLFATQGLFVP